MQMGIGEACWILSCFSSDHLSHGFGIWNWKNNPVSDAWTSSVQSPSPWCPGALGLAGLKKEVKLGFSEVLNTLHSIWAEQKLRIAGIQTTENSF